MIERSASFAIEATGGHFLAGQGERLFRGAAIDSRKITGGEMFVALPGSQVDGHEYASRAVQQGAALVVVERALEPTGDATWLLVEDSLGALHDITRAVRRQVPQKLVGITGSAGKTTTKELLASMLARQFQVSKSPGNLNNLYGFPLALLSIDEPCQWMVAEMGMSTPGELRGVSLLGRPDAALFTNVRPAHLMNFPNLRGITEAKAGLLAGLTPSGLVVINADDPEVCHIAEHYAQGAGRVLRYGFHQPAEVRGLHLTPFSEKLGSHFLLEVEGEQQKIELPVHGLYNAENCLAAAACAWALGVPLAEIAAATAEFEPSSMRGQVYRLEDGPTLIDDAYNSNPDAAEKALESAQVIPARRRIAVLGDMLELGPDERNFHIQVGERAANLGFVVVGVGERSRDLVDAALRHGAEAEHFPDAAAAAQWALAARGAVGGEDVSGKGVSGTALSGGALGTGDLVLVKGSRGVGLEAVVSAFKTLPGGNA
jgi:UDP-N-acetylmuramoyl-tripeptide--D-alanyl-D-alanine ligase